MNNEDADHCLETISRRFFGFFVFFPSSSYVATAYFHSPDKFFWENPLK